MAMLLALAQQWQWQLFLAFLSVVFVFVITGASSKKSLKLPPGPAMMPVLGNLHQVGRLPHRSLRELARRHGPVMLLRLGTVRTVVVSSAEAAREVMKTHDVDCCSRPASPGPKRLSYDLKNLGFAPYGEYWREMRKLFVLELLSMRRVRAASYAREQQVAKLVSNLSRLGRNRQPVALNEHIFGLTDGIIGTVAFGNVYGADEFPHKGRFQEVLDEAMEMMASFSAEDFFPGAGGHLVDRLTGLFGRRERVFMELDAFFEVIIEQHLDPARGKPDNGGDLVDVLIGLWKEQRGTLHFTKDHVKAIILDTFIGAIDTSSVTMLWAMSELIRNPRVLSKVQDEIRATVGHNHSGRRVQEDDVRNLSYLKMVVKETLRLHPPATLLVPRETMQSVQIGGYNVPAKTRILVNAWAIGRDPASWSSDSEDFNPDRFQGSDIDFSGAHFHLLPFGAGRRIFPGLAMGVMNVEFTLANLLYCFDWALPEGMTPENVSMEEAGALIFRRKAPLVLVPTLQGVNVP